MPFFRRDGSPASLEEWARLFESGNVAAQHLVRGWLVSTVWLGVDVSHHADGSLPLIFETMVFPPEWRESRGRWQWRYPDEASALAGHQLAVELAVMEARAQASEVIELSRWRAPPARPGDDRKLGARQ